MGIFQSFASDCHQTAFTSATYLFPVYATYLKSTFHFNIHQLNFLSLMKDLGSILGVLMQSLTSYIPNEYKVIGCALLNTTVFTYIALCMLGKVSESSFQAMCGFLVAGSTCQATLKVLSIQRTIESFPPAQLDTVLSILSSYASLGGSIVTVIHLGLHLQDGWTLLILIGGLHSFRLFVFFIVRTKELRLMERMN